MLLNIILEDNIIDTMCLYALLRKQNLCTSAVRLKDYADSKIDYTEEINIKNCNNTNCLIKI